MVFHVGSMLSSTKLQHAAAPRCPELLDDDHDEDRVHVIYSTNMNDLEGLLASVSSAVRSTSLPVKVHLLVREELAPAFKREFGITPDCQAKLGAKGSMAIIHLIDGVKVRWTKLGYDRRAGLNTAEAYARYYAHNMMERTVAIYLDVEHRTIGSRLRPKVCALKFPDGTDMENFLRQPEYNNGVFAVDLQRWAEKNITMRVEGFVAQQEACNHSAYEGGDQVPMLLAFLARPKAEVPEYAILNASWNTKDLGYKLKMDPNIPRQGKILHWNGRRKPWQGSGGP
eukprot:CAMPEP_0170353380 /NCGR_PEP_ID=MMETSP0116_2-20130129/78006_1 /TAXON_ID=400756 /ORGANISM="Durinskia baltica, Strain CSIRO CS-38" /LENGTH=283 /DNA_ID=CAMNT_0010607315 /DNA_START=156 /DNA_END=1004 /DNA_ORIENTATION=-